MEWFKETFSWMYWNIPSGIFFILLFSTIIGMYIWDYFEPNVNRKGFLPIVTSRGDRLFIGIMSAIAIHLLWFAIFSNFFILGATILSAIWFFIEARWG